LQLRVQSGPDVKDIVLGSRESVWTSRTCRPLSSLSCLKTAKVQFGVGRTAQFPPRRTHGLAFVFDALV